MVPKRDLLSAARLLTTRFLSHALCCSLRGSLRRCASRSRKYRRYAAGSARAARRARDPRRTRASSALGSSRRGPRRAHLPPRGPSPSTSPPPSSRDSCRCAYPRTPPPHPRRRTRRFISRLRRRPKTHRWRGPADGGAVRRLATKKTLETPIAGTPGGSGDDDASFEEYRDEKRGTNGEEEVTKGPLRGGLARDVVEGRASALFALATTLSAFPG